MLFITIIGTNSLSPIPLLGQGFMRYISPEVEASEIYNEGNVYQRDFLLFMDVLDKCHPAFAPGSNPVPFNIDEATRTGYLWADECRSVGDLWSYMQKIMVQLNDSHSTLVPEIDLNLVYPILFFSDDQNTYIRGIDEEHKSVIGKQISLINGLSLEDVYGQFKTIISSDNNNYFKDKVSDFLQLYSIWKHTSICPPDSVLHITFTDSTDVSIRPMSRNEMKIALPETTSRYTSVRQNNRSPFIYTNIQEKKIGYLQFNSCVDQESLRLQYLAKYPDISKEELEAAVSNVPRFDTFLDEMFDQMRNDSITTLVVDVRNNSGGDSRLCDMLLSRLRPVNNIKQIHSYTRFSEFWRQYYPALATEYEKSFIGAQQPLVMGKLYDNYSIPQSGLSESSASKETEGSYLRENDGENIFFNGDVIFVQNYGTYSSAGMLITTARDNDIGMIIGSESSYSPCGYGDILAWELPNTKIRGSVSHKIFIRPNSNDCNDGVLVPDVLLRSSWEDVVSGKDICWELVLENYSTDID